MFNNKDNLDGEYIKLLLVTPVAKQALNIYHGLRGYMITPEWNEASMEQAMSRILRATSHDLLIKRAKAKKDPKITIKIYRLAAIPKRGGQYSVDIKFYIE